MANNLAAVIPQLLAQGLLALRSNCVMPRLVNGDYANMAAEKGSTIDVPIPSAIAAQEVAPNNIAPATADVGPTKVQVPLDQWYEAPFYMTDKDLLECMNGTIPMQASEAIKSLANNVNGYLLQFYKDFYGQSGAAGTTPFATDTSAARAMRTVLSKQLCPPQDRRFVLDPDAYGNALGRPEFTNAQYRQANGAALTEGTLLRTLGFDWAEDQLMPYHTSTPLTAGACTLNGVQAVNVGSTDGGRTGTLSIAKATNASPLVKGDLITKAGDLQSYVVLEDVSLIVGNTTVKVAPANKVATAGGEVVTLTASHAVNLAFHRDAIAFATRPLVGATEGLGNIIQSATDPVSGLSLRLEVSREHKRTRYSYDILYGGKVVRREFGGRQLG